MTSKQNHVSITILDKEYRILCQPHEAESLRLAALYLDKKMRDIRNSGKVVGVDRIAVMAALNISHDFLNSHSDKEDYIHTVRDELQILLSRVEEVLETST